MTELVVGAFVRSRSDTPALCWARSGVPGTQRGAELGLRGAEVAAWLGWRRYQKEPNVTSTLGAVFGVTTCLSAQIREEPDDPLNYFIGGCATGALLGARAHSYMTGTTACLGFGITAALMKIGNKEGWRLTGPPKL
ncbi:PREDICTED: NADH dehydrogenase [ubiquinone] 1 alpha subcomplex subunit 11 [Tauraco erythrolophus]|uniref:NADH dehydrogenase [ubiquinone] 1 alpha subcomplex subunit 11 n=1 Tax=Tauraco erythrolophus TaxID=121530 RepID=UPI000523C53B|nr:PREDICTED: NADH dehydrogenase [ubiquinone] 1 alpha subcomplex subunit 11 [Tauraco erythrolophus]